MFFKQLVDPKLGCASYIVGCPASGKGVVIDPLENLGPEVYAVEASEQGLTITHVIDTHIHADHVSIGPELARRVGAEYNMYGTSEAALDFVPLHDSEVVALGAVELKVVHTPGHTPESLSLLVVDRNRSDEPWMILTGDSLFVGDVARPDLILGTGGEGTSEERASVLYDTMQWFLALPDYVEVYPGHFGASTCGGDDMSAKTMSTIGFERRHNKALAPKTRQAFISRVMDHLRPHPDRFREIKRVNRGESHKSVTSAPEVDAMSPDDMSAQSGRATILDVRPLSAYGKGHVPGSINVPYTRQGFGDQVGGMFSKGTAMIVVAEDDLVAGAASKELEAHGYAVLGMLRGGLPAWSAAGKAVASLKDVTPDELRRRMDSENLVVLDVREPWEYQQGHIPGAKLYPLGGLPTAAGELDPEGRYVVACATGSRSSGARAFLHRKGFNHVENLVGGTSLWSAAGHPLDR